MNSTTIRIHILVVLIGLISLSCNRNSFEGDMIVVELPGEAFGSFEGASLIAFDPLHPNKKATLISGKFESACYPTLSHEARFLFFQGKKEGDKKWQIWMLDMKSEKMHRVTDLPENCTHPVSLPDGTVVFSRDLRANGRQYSALYKCNSDGSDLNRLSFNQGKNIHASVLGEGRVLFSSSRQFPSILAPNLMIMRPDGTKSELYHRGTSASYPLSKGSESEDGYIYFINNKGELVRLLHRRPLHSAEILDPGPGGSYSSVAAFEGSECLVSWQEHPGNPYAIYSFDAAANKPPVLIRGGDKHLTDALLVKAQKKRPRILPSAVDPGKATGIIMSQDINHSMLPVKPGLDGDTIARLLRVSGTDGEIAVIEVKEDGSVYLEMDANTPFRFETMNSQGKTVRGPSDWIYLRPNERRACVGCHADPELTPKNVQPMAVKELPVVLSEKKKK